MISLLLALLLTLVCAREFHNPNSYFFTAAQLTPDELDQLVALYAAPSIAEQPDMTDFIMERVRATVLRSLNKIRVTSSLLPAAFTRLVEAQEKAQEKPSPVSSPSPTRTPGFQKRRLLSLGNDVFSTGSEDSDNIDITFKEADSDSSSSSSLDIDHVQPRPVVRGANGNHKHCESGNEVKQLQTDAFPDLSTVHPFLSVHVDEEEGTIHFTVEVPYIPFDARYIISFDPIEHAAEKGLACSSNYEPDTPQFDDKEAESSSSSSSDSSGELRARKTPVSIWAHAPNANYRDAFNSKQLYPAYYSDPDSKWLAQANGCSHVKYGATFTIAELANCSDAENRFALAITELATTDEASAISIMGVVWISLLQPSSANDLDTLDNALVVATWAHPFALTVDDRDSKIIIVDSANGGLRRAIDHMPVVATDSTGSIDRPRTMTLLRSATLVDGLLEVHLQTQINVPDDEACVPRNLTLHQITARELELKSMPPSLDDSGAYCVVTSEADEQKTYVMLQNWKLVAKAGARVIDGDFVLLFCYETDFAADAVCDEGNAVHRTAIGLRISREKSESNEAISFNSEITQHVALSEPDKIAKVHVGDFQSGQRVCMQSYVIGPKQLTSQIEVQLLDAWLCVLPTGTVVADNALVCEQSEHYVKLVWRRSNDSTEVLVDKTRDVVVQHPGAYGLLSVGVCFDANARFTDSQNRSLIQSHQRFESRLRMQPATIRRNGPIHIMPMYPTLAELARGPSRAYDPSIGSLSQYAEEQSLQAKPISEAVFRQTLHQARLSGAVVETHGHEFNVVPEDVDEPFLSEDETAGGLVLVFIVMVAVALIIVCWLALPQRMREIASRFD